MEKFCQYIFPLKQRVWTYDAPNNIQTKAKMAVLKLNWIQPEHDF
jgi:hypothetical protein